ncbi:MAG: hypothetical protein A2Y70_01840 [Candidatus Aminicenantes bacterium RBG_13_64_14]|nr:MAG: hypothetical protein A2Y70_01840 [Candidatus Aminicenantes bacterium RBG_13_64_14]
MKKSVLWFLAGVLTLASFFYQWRTGPTHPLRGRETLCGRDVSYRLERSGVITRPLRLKVPVPKESGITGTVEYQRFKKGDAWKPERTVDMTNELVSLTHGGKKAVPALTAPLLWPGSEEGRAPMAGKLAYKVTLSCGDEKAVLNGGRPVVIRFRGDVPAWAIIPHILIMFLAILLGVAAGLEALRPGGRPRVLAFWTLILLFLGGFILGPLMQKYAFGALWTGFPLGTDLTDNKTLIVFLGWLAALLLGRKGRGTRFWILGAALMMLVVYLIPHSLLGSEFDYTSLGR